MKQVKSVLLDKVCLENPDDHGGCDFLHHFLSGVVAGTFPKRKFFELTVLNTDIPIDKEWDDCCYHQDLADTILTMKSHQSHSTLLLMTRI
jgi:hypothetical protein